MGVINNCITIFLFASPLSTVVKKKIIIIII